MLDTQRKRVDALQILLVEDNPGDARLFEEHLRDITEEPELQWERDLAAGISALDEGAFDVVALDLGLPDSEGTGTVERIRAVAPDIPIVVLTGQESANLALSMLEVGATEYIRKSELAPSLLVRTLRWAVERKSMERKITERERQVRSVLDALAANVTVLDRDGTIIDVNEKWKQFARENDGDLDTVGVGANYLAACAPAEEAGSSAIPAVREEIRAVIEGEKELFEYQYPCHGPDEERWFLLRATPLDRAEGGAVVAHINVTERVQAVRKQRLLSAAIEQAQDAVLITAAETLDEPGPEIVYANSAVEAMTGYAEDELLGQTPRLLQGPDTDPETLGSLREALEAGDEWSGETVNYRKDGTPYRVQWSLAPVRGEGEEIEYWVSVQRDVTEERERERRLAQMAQALEQIDDKVFITDREGRIQYVNEAFEEITGYREDEVVGKTPAVLQSGEQGEAFYEEMWDTILSGETFRAEFVNEKKDGTRYVEDESISPMTNEDGEITHFVSAGRDITEQKEQEEALRRQKHLLEQTQRLAGAWEVDLRSGEVSWSEEVYRIHEVEPGTELDVRDGIEFYAPEARPKIREVFERCVEEGEPYDVELPIDTAKGNRRWVRAVGAPSETETGEVVKVAGAIQDITERKEAEEALKKREAQLRGLANSIPGVVYQFYALPDGTYGNHFVSAHAESMLGISAEADEFFERVVERIPSTHRDQFLSSLDEAVEQEATWRHEFPYRHPSGETIWVLGTSTPERRDDELIFNGVLLDVTERREAQEALEEREEYLSVMLQSIGDAVVATDQEGYVTEMNPVAEELTGWSQEKAEGKLLDDVLTLHSAQTEETVESPVEKVLRGGRTVGLANRTILTSRDGTEYQIANSAAPIRSGEDDLLGVVLVFRDVTEKYERRRRMERQNDLFAKAQDLANVGGWEYDVRSGEVVWTEEVYRIHGLPLDAEASPEQSLQFYHEEDRPVIEEAFARSVEEGEPYDLELRLITADGDERWVRTRGEPQTGDGEVVRVRGTIQDVTDRKNYEEELERTTNLLRLAEEMTEVGGWSVDVRGERPYQAEWTDHLYDIFGLSSREEPPTEEVFEYYHPDDRDRHREAVMRAEQTGKGWDQELRITRADGTERWVRNIGVSITEEGEVVEIRGAIQDITERKRRETRLEEMHDRMELALDHTRSIVFEINLETDEISRMGAYERFFGIPSQEVDTREQHEDRFVHPDDRADFRAFYREMARGERASGTIEYRTNPDYGDVRWIRDIVQRVEGEKRLLGLARDVTGRKEQRERMRLLAEALEQVGDKVVITDQEGRIEFVNDAFKHITGFGEEEVLGETPNVLQSGLHDDAFYRELWDTILAGDTFRAEIVNERKDGTTYVEDETISPVVDEEGNVTHFVSTGRDVTDRKEREEELKEAKEEAEQMNRLKSAFLANMSHEIRTPLTSILGFAEMITEELGEAERAADLDRATLTQFARLIEESGHRLMETLEGVLNLSKLEAEEMDLSVESVDLAAEASDVAEQFWPQAEEAGVDLQVELQTSPTWAGADPEGVQIVLRNLVGNALKYTEEGGRAWVRVHETDEAAVLEVEDTGIGMDPEAVPDLFEAFVQESEGIGRAYEGSGLGLTLVKKVVEEMKGEIEVETEKGEGSCFIVRLPRAEGGGGKSEE